MKTKASNVSRLFKSLWIIVLGLGLLSVAGLFAPPEFLQMADDFVSILSAYIGPVSILAFILVFIPLLFFLSIFAYRRDYKIAEKEKERFSVKKPGLTAVK